MQQFSKLGIAFVSTLFLLSYAVSLQAEVRQGIEVLIAKDEVIDDDVYIIAQKAIVNGTIKGDLIIFGQQVEINGSVEGDLIASVQQVSVNGKVGDDIRIAGQILSIRDNADIGDDLIAAGYSLECTEASQVQGEVNFAGYQSVLAGNVGKKVRIASAKCELSGTFGEDIEAVVDGGSYSSAGFWADRIPDVPPGLTLKESADIAGNLKYQSTQEALIDPGSTISGTIEHSQIDSGEAKPVTVKDRLLVMVRQFFALVLVGILLIYVCPKWTGQVVNNVQRRPLASMGWGLLTLVTVITGTILLLVATIAIAILLGYISLGNLILTWVGLGALTMAVVVIGFLIYSTWVAKVIVGVWIGNRIINGSEWNARQRGLALLLGVLVLVVISWIPTLGSIVSLGVILTGIGSSAIWMFGKAESEPAAKQKLEPLS